KIVTRHGGSPFRGRPDSIEALRPIASVFLRSVSLQRTRHKVAASADVMLLVRNITGRLRIRSYPRANPLHCPDSLRLREYAIPPAVRSPLLFGAGLDFLTVTLRV